MDAHPITPSTVLLGFFVALCACEPLLYLNPISLGQPHVAIVVEGEALLPQVLVLWVEQPRHSVVSSVVELMCLVMSTGHGCRKQSVMIM